jgi:predicted dithiol-disulfide oxidoreductase (DUF899 family)
MSELRYPNESREYRDAREALLKEEQELVAKVKSVAAKRRTLPPGGQLKEDYVFQWANDGTIPVLLARPWSMGLIDPGIRSVETMQLPVMHVFRKYDGTIFHFWGTESSSNHLDTVWPYWNLMDFTPEGAHASTSAGALATSESVRDD